MSLPNDIRKVGQRATLIGHEAFLALNFIFA